MYNYNVLVSNNLGVKLFMITCIVNAPLVFHSSGIVARIRLLLLIAVSRKIYSFISNSYLVVEIIFCDQWDRYSGKII
jgi:hypothetical protein